MLLEKNPTVPMTDVMQRFGEYLQLFIQQFAGGPGPPENNLIRFALPALFWASLLAIAWSRQRGKKHPRERLLLWGFALGLARELMMFTEMSMRIMFPDTATTAGAEHLLLEHVLTMAAIVVVSGAFVRYALDDAEVSRKYLLAGAFATALSFGIAYGIYRLQWPFAVLAPMHRSPAAQTFHVGLSVMILIAIGLLWKERGWLRNTVILALSFFLISEVLALVNFATDSNHAHILCPLSNSFHIFAIPILGFVYLREQSLEKRAAENKLTTYREHLEELVNERTAELEMTNTRLAHLAERHRLILETAGDGICGIDHQGKFIFVNETAASMLGYKTDDLINQSSHATWLHSHPDGHPFSEHESPIYATYKHGQTTQADDALFWRRDGRTIPVRFVSKPAFEEKELAGAVVVFRDITRLKEAEAENIRLGQEAAALEERQRIAAEMHDGLAQTLSYIGLTASRSREVLEAGQIADADGNLHQIQTAVGRATDEVRRSISTLQEKPLAQRSLQEVLMNTLDLSFCENGTEVKFDLSADCPIQPTATITEQILRVAQEALLNACRHADASEVTIKLMADNAECQLDVQDDGCGFDPDSFTSNGTSQSHYGLRIMEARAARMNGELKIVSQPGHGTCVTLTWPAESAGNTDSPATIASDEAHWLVQGQKTAQLL